MSSSDGDRSGVTWRPKTEADFHVLSRSLTVHWSQRYGAKTGFSNKKDIEIGSLPDYEDFVLRDYLTSSIEANQGAGIPRKCVGVTWENLQVVAPGCEDDKVR